MNEKSVNRVASFVHINPRRGVIETNSFSPIVVMKKIRLRRSNTSDNSLECLPDVAEEEEDVTIQEDPTKKDTSKLFGHELSFIHTMNNEERNAHVKKCLEMSLENKITPKNAFALQLIDCLSMLVQEKQDFSKMACTLDAGAKIYSNRVDALHLQVVKLADEVILNQKQKERHTKEDDEDEGMIKENRRENKRKKNIIVSSDSLKRKLKGKDPKSRFVKLEGVPGSITNCARRDPKDLSYSLENNLPFWKNWDQYVPLRSGGTVPLPQIKILREKEKATDSVKTEQTDQDQDKNNEYVNECIEEGKGSHEDISDLSQESFGCDEPATDIDHEYVKEEDAHKLHENRDTDNEEVGVIATAMKRLSTESNVNEIKSSASRLEAMKILFKEASDYHYLDMKNVHFWAGPEFWKRSNTAVRENNKFPKKKKEPINISYDCNLTTIEEKWGSLFKKKTKLTHKTISNWKNNKLVLPTDLKIEINLFFELFHLTNIDPDENIQDSKEKITSSGEEDADLKCLTQGIIDDTELNDEPPELSGSSTNPDPLNCSFYEQVPGQSADNVDTLNSAFYNVGMIPQSTSEEIDDNDLGRVIGIKVSQYCETSFDESTLIPAPKIVSVEPIKYSMRPIQVDMRHLKETMMSVIHEEIEKDMQEKMATPCSSTTSKLLIPETRFSQIMKKLPNRLEKTTAQNLSIAMAFLALLTVTNENNLQLEDTGDSDVIIRFEN